DLIQYRLEREQLVERLDASGFENDIGRFTLIAYRSAVDPFPHIALTRGDLGRYDATGRPVDCDEPTLVRMHSQDLLGDVFGDAAQPSGATLRQAMRMIHDADRGALVYLRHERTGSGLLKRLQTASLPADHALSSDDRPLLGEGQATPGIMPPVNKGAYGI